MLEPDLNSHVPTLAWKTYPFRAEPPRKGHYREYPPWGKTNNPSTFHMFSPAWKLWQIKEYQKNFVSRLLSRERGWMIQVFLSFPSKGVVLLLVHLKARNVDAISFNFTRPTIYKVIQRRSAFLALFLGDLSIFAPTYSRVPIHSLECKKRIMNYELFPS